MFPQYPQLHPFLNRHGSALELLTALLTFCEQNLAAYKTWFSHHEDQKQQLVSNLSTKIYNSISGSRQSYWYICLMNGEPFDWLDFLKTILPSSAPDSLIARILARTFTDCFKYELIKQYLRSRLTIDKDRPIKPGDLIFCPAPNRDILKKLYPNLSMNPEKRNYPIPDSPTAIFKIAKKVIFDDLDVIPDLSLWYPLRRFFEPPDRVIPAICIPTTDFNQETHAVKTWGETWEENGKLYYFTVKPANDKNQTKILQQAIDAALEEGGSILVFPEVSCTPDTADDIFAYVKPRVQDRLLLILGSWHGTPDQGHQLAARYFWRDQDGRINDASICHKKFNAFEGYMSPEGQAHIEFLGTPPRKKSIRIYQTDTMSFTTLICKDVLGDRTLLPLDELTPSFILVPAMSDTHDLFATLAVKAKGWQGTTIVSITPTSSNASLSPAWGMFHGPGRNAELWTIGASFMRNARNAMKLQNFDFQYIGAANHETLPVPAACIIKLAASTCVWRSFPA